MRDAWAEEFTRAARAHWTPERERDLCGGKDLAILPSAAPMLLRALGLLHRDATMPPAQMRKFLQVNHVVRVLDHAMGTLVARREVTDLVDAGCGRSYLTLLLAHRWGERVRVVGIDRNPDIIAECRRRAELAGLAERVTFRAAAVEDATDLAAHAVFGLHACDTATDDAIALGVRLGAELIAVAPCCQAELARGWADLAPAAGAPFAPIWRAGHLRREIAAHLTDAMRVLLLRARGYAATPMEFIGAEHTKKNTLIRAELRAPDPAARDEYAALVAATGGCGIKLGALI